MATHPLSRHVAMPGPEMLGPDPEPPGSERFAMLVAIHRDGGRTDPARLGRPLAGGERTAPRHRSRQRRPLRARTRRGLRATA